MIDDNFTGNMVKSRFIAAFKALEGKKCDTKPVVVKKPNEAGASKAPVVKK